MARIWPPQGLKSDKDKISGPRQKSIKIQEPDYKKRKL